MIVSEDVELDLYELIHDKCGGILTTSQACVILGLSRNTVVRYFDRGRIKGYKIPGSPTRKIPVEHLVAFIRDCHIPVGFCVSRINWLVKKD